MSFSRKLVLHLPILTALENTIVNRTITVDKKKSEKILAFCEMILVGISRSWEAFEISSSQVTFLIPSRLTFSIENLQTYSIENQQPKFSCFILRMLGCF